MIDSNGDQADIDLDEYERDADGNWRENSPGADMHSAALGVIRDDLGARTRWHEGQQLC